MRVRFLKIASVQGQGYRPGETADLPKGVAEVYIRLEQAEAAPEPKQAPEPEADEVDDETKPRRGRKPTRRGGKPVETADDQGRETR